MRTISDKVATFGRFGGLVGIVSEPTPERTGLSEAASERPAVIILNTGVIHRVGAGRISTIWARHMANAGRCVLRFDLSGVGDSERRSDTLAPAEAAVADLRDAVDWLQSTRGIPRVIVMGLCSGADLSLVYAGSDSRVCGMVIIDPSTPPTRAHHVRKMLTRKVWKRQIETMVQRLTNRRGQPPPATGGEVTGAAAGEYDSAQPSLVQLRQILSDAYRSAFAQTVKALAIFTTGAAWYNYRRQLFDAFPDIPFEGNLQLEYFERCDHTITHEANRARLFNVVDAWLEHTEFNGPAAAVEEARHPPARGAADSRETVTLEF